MLKVGNLVVRMMFPFIDLPKRSPPSNGHDSPRPDRGVVSALVCPFGGDRVI
jgi:hypothetical protein